MAPMFECPACGAHEFDFKAYESMMVVTVNHALFTLRCPKCGTRVSGLRTIPPELEDEVRFAAVEIGAGMGRAC